MVEEAGREARLSARQSRVCLAGQNIRKEDYVPLYCTNKRGLEKSCGTRLRDAVPGLCGCEACGTTQLIAAPSIGICAACGTDMTVLMSVTTLQSVDQEPEVLSLFAA